MESGTAINLRYDGAYQALHDLGLAVIRPKTAGVLDWAGRWAGKPLAWAGNRLVGALGRSTRPEVAAWAPRLGNFGKGLATQMGSWGLLGGGLEAALAEPGERGKAFARGAGMGALTGLGWGAGERLALRGAGRFVPGGAARLEELGKGRAIFSRTGALADRSKILGSKALAFGGGVAGSELLSKAVGQPGMIDIVRGQNERPAYAMPQVYGPLMSGLPLDPQQYYNQGYG
jgi:hypothetical protein